MLKATDPRRRQRHAAVFDPPLDLPPPLPEEPHVAASLLSNGEKNQLWRFLKAHRPDRVLFFEEPVVRELLGLGAEPTFPLSELRAAGLDIDRARWS